MLNLCIFIFILYAVSYSAKVILFGSKRKSRRTQTARTSQKVRNNAERNRSVQSKPVRPLNRQTAKPTLRRKTPTPIKLNQTRRAA